MASPTWWTWVWANSGSWWWMECCSSWGCKDSDTTNWTEQSISCKVRGYMSYKLESRLLGEISRTWDTQMWNETISCHINQQEMPQPSLISHLQVWMRAPKTMIQRVLLPSQWLLRSWGNVKSRVSKETGLATDSWGAYERKWIQWAQRIACSDTQNAEFLNLIPDLWCSDCLFPLLQIYIAWLPPYLLGNAFSELLRYCFLGPES